MGTEAMHEGSIPVCWTLRGDRNDSQRFKTQVHRQGIAGKTACGIATDGLWDFWCHNLADGDSGPTCKRCLKIKDKSP